MGLIEKTKYNYLIKKCYFSRKENHYVLYIKDYTIFHCKDITAINSLSLNLTYHLIILLSYYLMT
jgi:hypothetical protein